MKKIFCGEEIFAIITSNSYRIYGMRYRAEGDESKKIV
jgi:predicted site-specific integrase-resolvase